MTFSSRRAAALGLRRAAGLALAIAVWCGTCGMTEALADPLPEPPPPPPAPSLADPGAQSPPPAPTPVPDPAGPGAEPPPPPPAPSHPIIDAGAIDSLLVSFEDVKALSGGGYLDYAVSQQPTTVASADPGGECALALSDEGASAVFGTNWTAFRDADTTGSNIYLRQAIGVYPDPGAAQAVFDKLVSGLKTCTFTRTGSIGIASLTGNTAAWLIPGDRTCAEEARVVKNVFFRVGSCRQTPAAPVVRVANQISGRISAA